jgi:hypothetical protein
MRVNSEISVRLRGLWIVLIGRNMGSQIYGVKFPPWRGVALSGVEVCPIGWGGFNLRRSLTTSACFVDRENTIGGLLVGSEYLPTPPFGKHPDLEGIFMRHWLDGIFAILLIDRLRMVPDKI